MKIVNTNTALTTLKGEVIKDNEGTEVTIGNVISNVLSGQGIENPSRAYQFAKKFAVDENVELKAEDIVYLKKIVETNKMLSALVAGQIIELLEV